MLLNGAIWTIGCGQLINWGVLYYGFGVLLVPLEQFFDAPRWLVAGLTTLARPYWVLHRCGADRAGYANGVIARWQQLARAGGPVGAAAVAASAGYSVVFGILVVALLAMSYVAARHCPRG